MKHISLTKEESTAIRTFLDAWAKENRSRYSWELWRAACKHQEREDHGWIGSGFGGTHQELARAWHTLQHRPLDKATATTILQALRTQVGRDEQ